jgi:Flp pilus assembly protein TadD
MTKIFQVLPALLACVVLAGCAKPRERQQVDPHLQLAFDLVDKDPNRALEELKRAKRAPEPEIAYARGLALQRLGKPGEAEAAFRASIEAVPEAEKPRTALSLLLLAQGKVAEARVHLQFLVVNVPSAGTAVFLNSLCSTSEKEREEALFALRNWQKNRPPPAAGTRESPIGAEYYLLLSWLETDKALRFEAMNSAKRGEFESVQSTLVLLRYALVLNHTDLARELVRKLSTSELQQAELVEVARRALDLGDDKAAGSALKRVPGSVRTQEVLELRGRYELLMGRPQRALAPFQSARKLAKPEDATESDRLDIFIAMSLVGAGDAEKATGILKDVLKRTPAHIGGQILLSKLEIEAGQLQEARNRLSALTASHPKNANILKECAGLRVRLKDYAEAEALYRKWISLEPSVPRSRILLANVLRLRGETKAVRDVLSKALEEFPESIKVRRALAGELMREKLVDEAILVAKGRSGVGSLSVEEGLLLADLYETLKRPLDLRKTLEELVKSSPRSDTAWSALARVQLRGEELSQAEASLRKAVKLNPASLGARVRLAGLLKQVGRADESAKEFEAVVQLAGNNALALNNAAMLYAVELEQPEQAVKYAERAYELAPGHAAIQDTLGWSLVLRDGKGDLERGTKILAEAHKRLQSAESGYHYGLALLKNGEEREGKALLRQALAESEDETWRGDVEERIR